MPLENLRRTTEKGVFYRTEPGRKNGVRPDRQFILVYVLGGKKYRGVFGWESEGFRLSAAAEKIQFFRGNFKTGEGPVCLEGERIAKKKEIEDRAAAERAQIEQEKNRPTIKRLWELYQESNPEIKGIVQDRNRYKHYLSYTFGGKTVDQISSLDVDRLRIGMMAGRIGPSVKNTDGKKVRSAKSPQTIKHVLVLLRRIIRFGESRKLCSANHIEFKMPKVDNQVTEHLNPDQVEKLLKALNQEKDLHAVSIIKFALLTGRRKGEILSLKWQDVDLDRRIMRIVSPKGGKSISLPISEAAAEVLRNISQVHELVFPGRKEKKRHDIKGSIKRIRAAGGLPKGFRPLHGLRHHFASELASSGKVDLYTLQCLLGHKDPATTMRYAHLRDETLRKAIKVAEQALLPSGAEDKTVTEGAPEMESD